MNFSTIATTWALLDKTARMIILTEPGRLSIAEKIKADNSSYTAEVRIIDITAASAYASELNRLTEKDLLLVLLTVDGFIKKGFRDQFSPFTKPSGLACKYIFIRLDIPEAALLSGLNTDIAKVEARIDAYRAFSSGKKVRVTSEKGTDITVQVSYQELVPYDARPFGGHAFLPAAEISEELVPGSANGVIVADVTVGELRFGADLIDLLGLVDKDVRITVENGMITDISGEDIAVRLKNGLGRLGRELQVLVELGHGLSDLTPTGIIGVDESMSGTCHFGIGNRNPYHVDVVVSSPEFEVLE